MEFYTPDEVAKVLKVSKSTVLSMIHSGRIGATQVGGGAMRKTFRVPYESLREAVTKSNTNELPAPRKEVELSNEKLHPAVAKAMGFEIPSRRR